MGGQKKMFRRPTGSKPLTWRFSQGTSSTELVVKVHGQQEKVLNLP